MSCYCITDTHTHSGTETVSVCNFVVIVYVCMHTIVSMDHSYVRNSKGKSENSFVCYLGIRMYNALGIILIYVCM